LRRGDRAGGLDLRRRKGHPQRRFQRLEKQWVVVDDQEKRWLHGTSLHGGAAHTSASGTEEAAAIVNDPSMRK
jgi:hypothetical protein